MDLIFQEYDFEIIVKPGKANVGYDHLSWITSREEATNVNDSFPYSYLLQVMMVDDQLEYISYFLTMGIVSEAYNVLQKKQLVLKAIDFQLITRQLYRLGFNGILCRCILQHERESIIMDVNEWLARGNYVGKMTIHTIFHARP